MLNKNRFKEIARKEESSVVLPGDIFVEDIDINDEDLLSLEKDMDRYSFKVINVYEKNDKRSVSKYYLDMNELSDDLEPIYLLKEGGFVGVCISLTFNAEKSQGVFLVDGSHFGTNKSGSTTENSKDISTYSFGFK